MDPAPGNKNLITDILGIQVGHAEDKQIGTGVTVVIGNKPFSAAVDVRGGGPGTRETDMLNLENSIGRADAIVLSGGSAFGLDACSEVQDLLRRDNKGYKVGKAGLGLISKERDNKDKRKTSLKLTRKGKDLIEKIFGMLNEDIIDFEIEE